MDVACHPCRDGSGQHTQLERPRKPATGTDRQTGDHPSDGSQKRNNVASNHAVNLATQECSACRHVTWPATQHACAVKTPRTRGRRAKYRRARNSPAWRNVQQGMLGLPQFSCNYTATKVALRLHSLTGLGPPASHSACALAMPPRAADKWCNHSSPTCTKLTMLASPAEQPRRGTLHPPMNVPAAAMPTERRNAHSMGRLGRRLSAAAGPGLALEPGLRSRREAAQPPAWHLGTAATVSLRAKAAVPHRRMETKPSAPSRCFKRYLQQREAGRASSSR